MPRPPEASDAEHRDDPRLASQGGEVSISASDVEEEAARAEARAAAARARAIRLRQLAREASPALGATPNDPSIRIDAADELEPQPAGSTRSRRPRLRRPGRKAVAVCAAIVFICASLGASGYMAWEHRAALHERQRAAEFIAAARQGVVTLMSIDVGKAKEDVQRIIDDSTGDFKAQLLLASAGLANAVEQSKVSVKVTVGAAAVESMTDDSAIVLVAATSEGNKPDDKRPRSWRLSVTLKRDDGRPKMSKVEYMR
ncbi:MAG: hypothetical protein ACRDT5_07190 [Mycobacterium sp.]